MSNFEKLTLMTGFVVQGHIRFFIISFNAFFCFFFVGSTAYKNVVLGFVACLLYTLSQQLLGIVLFLLQVRNDKEAASRNTKSMESVG